MAETPDGLRIDELRAVLGELHRLVWGECPSLLNEDSGGNAELDIRIHKALSDQPPSPAPDLSALWQPIETHAGDKFDTAIVYTFDRLCLKTHGKPSLLGSPMIYWAGRVGSMVAARMGLVAARLCFGGDKPLRRLDVATSQSRTNRESLLGGRRA